MGYDLILVRVPPGAAEEQVAEAARAAQEAEEIASRLPDPAAEERKRALAAALRAAHPELKGGEPDYAALASAEGITEDEARGRYRWWELAGPEDGARIQIALYDSWASISMPWSAGDSDLEELWGYLEVLVREGGFIVYDPQGPNVVDVAAGPFPSRQPVPRGERCADLVDRITDAALTELLRAAGYRKFGRTWRRTADGAIQVFHVQVGRHESYAECGITLSAGVYFAAVAKRLGLFPRTDAPKEHDCQVRKQFTPVGRGDWKVRLAGAGVADPDAGRLLGRLFAWLDRRADRAAPAQIERATREIREVVERETLPWLARMADLPALRDELTRTGPLQWAAAASLELGEPGEAIRLLRRAIARKNVAEAELTRWGRENGLTL